MTIAAKATNPRLSNRDDELEDVTAESAVELEYSVSDDLNPRN